MIVRIDGQAFKDADHLKQALKSLHGDFDVRVYRGKEQVILTGRKS